MKKESKLFFIPHILFWIYDFSREYFYWDVSPSVIAEDFILLPVLFYINYFFIVPAIIRVKNQWSFLLWFGVFVLMMSLFYGPWMIYHEYLDPNKIAWNLAFFIHISYYYGGISLALKLGHDWLVNEERTNSLILQKTTNQIQLLKSNINIPFMLSILDDTELTSNEAPEKAKDTILQLSNVLRHGLYEVQKDEIPLEHEIEVIKDYIQLHNNLEKKQQLHLLVEVEKCHLIIPNLLVKLISQWKEQIERNFNTTINLSISARNNKTSLRLPVQPTFNFETFSQEIPEIALSNFKTKYLLLDQSFLIEITYLTPNENN